MISFASIDPSFNGMGVISGDFDLDGTIVSKSGVTFSVKPNSSAKSKNEDFVRRCHILFTQVYTYVEAVKPKYIFVEIPMGSQSNKAAKTAAAACMMIGVLKTLTSSWGCQIVTVTPIAVKKAAVGKNSAEKDEILEWAINKWPEFPWERATDGRVLKKNHNLADAFGVTEAGILKLTKNAK